MHPSRKVDMVLQPGETKVGKGLAGPSGPVEAPTAAAAAFVPQGEGSTGSPSREA